MKNDLRWSRSLPRTSKGPGDPSRRNTSYLQETIRSLHCRVVDGSFDTLHEPFCDLTAAVCIHVHARLAVQMSSVARAVGV